MFSTRRDVIRLITWAIPVIVVIIIVGYALWRSAAYTSGPKITVIQPPQGASIATSSVTIVGQAERITALYLNNKAISIDETGNFKETILLFPGINILTLEGKDQFKRSAHTTVTLIRTGQ